MVVIFVTFFYRICFGSIMDNITILQQEIITIKKIIHPKYDECLIFQDLNGEINLLKIQLITK